MNDYELKLKCNELRSQIERLKNEHNKEIVSLRLDTD